MAVISFTIADNKLYRLVDAINGLIPVPVDGNGNPLFTENQWAKEAIRRYLTRLVARYENKVFREANEILEDDTLIS